MRARLYLDGAEVDGSPVTVGADGVTLELFGVKFAPGAHALALVVEP